MKNISHKIIFEGNNHNQLRFHEINAIMLLMNYFNSNIICVRTASCKTPDLKIKNVEWELKSPIGNGPNTIEKILKKATKQSKNIVLDFSRIKMDEKRAIDRLKFYLCNNKHSIRRLLVITKRHKIVDFMDLI